MEPTESAVWICRGCQARFRAPLERCPLDGAELEEVHDPMVGRRLGGRYLVEERIGEGGMGTVYRARHEIIGREVAIKVLSTELVSDASSRRRLLREARAVNRIAHEHIIDISDYGETEDGRVFLVMEYLRGRPLDLVVRAEGPFPVARALTIARQVCLALGRAHHAGVVHRDVKPENVFVLDTPDGSDFVKLLDFGLAHVKGEGRLTATGAVFGTPEYMSPEQVRGEQATARSDLYAVGCLVFEMLTTRPPFVGDTGQVLRGHLKRQPPSLAEHCPSAPEELVRLVASLLEKEPARRPPSALLVADSLANVLASVGADEASSGAPPEASRAEDESGEAAGRTTGPGAAPVDLVASWERRLARFQALLERAPHDEQRGRIAERMADLSETIAQMRRLHEQLVERDRDEERRRGSRRSTLLRIGSALDALGRDEARLSEQVREARERLEACSSEVRSLAEQVVERWAQLGPPPQRAEELERKRVGRVQQLAEAAEQWLRHERALRAVRAEVATLEGQHEDLRFQIAQLRGRMALLGAEDDIGREEGQDASPETRLDELYERAATQAEPIVRYFLGVPALRDEVLQDRPTSMQLGGEGGQ